MADTKSLSERRQAYWRDNIRIMAWLMAVWFIAVSYTHLTLPTIYSV